MRQGLKEALDERSRLGLGEGAADDAVVEGGGLAELENDSEKVVVLDDIEDLENVGVRGQKSHDLRLLVKTSSVGSIGEDPFVDNLTGDEVGQDWAESSDDGAEAAA
ncbi:hypothetical protein PanWU01x14_187890, partial [Parasponia andersonii]